MATPIPRMKAFVRARVGMRVCYDCPRISGESYRADKFFMENRGKTGVITGFPMKQVGPLDIFGRLPGLYFQEDAINVRFDGEDVVHEGLNLVHFVVLDKTPAIVPEADFRSSAQRADDLPIPFYPGDLVHKIGDLLRVPRFVECVQFDLNGRFTCTLAETEEMAEERKKREAADTKSWPSLLMSSLLKSETCLATELALTVHGRIYQLYEEPQTLAFGSAEDEVQFWAREGISRFVPRDARHDYRLHWTLEEARAMLEAGTADLIVQPRFHNGEYDVRRLHECFAAHRERARAAALSLMTPPLDREISVGEAMSGLAKLMSGH